MEILNVEVFVPVVGKYFSNFDGLGGEEYYSRREAGRNI